MKIEEITELFKDLNEEVSKFMVENRERMKHHFYEFVSVEKAAQELISKVNDIEVKLMSDASKQPKTKKGDQDG